MGAGAELFYEKPLHLVRGAGVWMYDAAGARLPRCVQQCAARGSCPPGRGGRRFRPRRRFSPPTPATCTAIFCEYAERLTARLPAHLDACIFVNSGSEANDVAWRMAQMASGHRGGLVMEHAYHGITDAVAALTPSVGRPHDPRVVDHRAAAGSSAMRR